ncbi:MAG: glycoside hydrolase domain-containing protein [Muribaculaceae bacterium]
MKNLLVLFALFSMLFVHPSWAQDDVTDAFQDLQRKGAVSESDSKMRKAASASEMKELLAEQPAVGFFCFTEDRLNDIRLRDALPAHWLNRTPAERLQFSGECQPGEFYTWQIGVYAPYKTLNKIGVKFSDFKTADGHRIKASAIRCFNLGGTNKDGIGFTKQISIAKGEIQPLWIGMDMTSVAPGVYKGRLTVIADGKQQVISAEISVKGNAIANHGTDDGWRKSRLSWLDSRIGEADTPTAPYTALKADKNTITYLGGYIELAPSGLPRQIVTQYNQANQLDPTVANRILSGEMRFVIETDAGEEIMPAGKVRITHRTPACVKWQAVRKSRNFEVTCLGTFNFDGFADYKLQVKALRGLQVKDIRMEVPYTEYASKYMMGLGHKGGFRPDSLITWKWNVERHQDKIWMGNVNAGLNFCFRDENYVRPLVNVYYALGKLNLPTSWGNANKGGINISAARDGEVQLIAYSGARHMQAGEQLHYNFGMLITPVKPIDLHAQATERFYHSNSDLSANYIAEAKKAGATMINVHHKKDIYPFINYPYYDEAVPELKRFVAKANSENLKVRVYYTTRELTIKTPELWALRSLGSEVIHDGPGKDSRTLIHPNGPHEWLNKNLGNHFIPAWYNAFREGKYAGDMDLSVITTPDSRWNNYYLEGLDWMIKNLGVDGVYIDDSALDRTTLQRARRVMDADGKRRLIDIHSWNHMNQWAGYANSLHLYTELLPYVDRLWIGEAFSDAAPADFWLVEMSGIPFGLMSESLQTKNMFRGFALGMLPRLPWSGNPVPMWKLWDEFGMQSATMHGFWETTCPVKTDNPDLKATVYTNGDKALLVIANWTDMPQSAKVIIDEKQLGFKPTKYELPEIRNLQWGGKKDRLNSCEIMGRSGLIVLLTK